MTMFRLVTRMRERRVVFQAPRVKRLGAGRLAGFSKIRAEGRDVHGGGWRKRKGEGGGREREDEKERHGSVPTYIATQCPIPGATFPGVSAS